jgi:hypothetical protein
LSYKAVGYGTTGLLYVDVYSIGAKDPVDMITFSYSEFSHAGIILESRHNRPDFEKLADVLLVFCQNNQADGLSR